MTNFFKRLLRAKIGEIEDWQDPDREANPMPCPEIIFEGIDAAFYGRLLHQAIAAGAEFDGLEVTYEHVTLTWKYDPPSQILRVTCTKKPFYATCELVEQHVRDLVAKARETTI